jgi:hypothetical protein
MLNVIEFREKTPRSRGSRPRRRPASAGPDISELACRVRGLQSKASEAISHAILKLGLAAQHARQFAESVRDPAARKNFDAHISAIERLIQTVREMALKL